MPLIYYAVKTRSGERQARLPLTVEGEFGTTISTFSSATFSLDVNSRSCPANYQDYLDPHLFSILVVEEDKSGYSKPIWMGMINDTPSNSDGKVTITTASLEWYLTTRRVKDCRFGVDSDIMDIPSTLISQVEAGGVGIGLLTDCPASGTKRALVLRESDGQSVVDVLAALDLEWTIALDWADPSQAVVTKTFTSRYPRLGVIDLHPEFMVSSPGNIFHWDYAAPMTEGKTATYVVAVGDGTGDLRTTSLPKIDTARESAGYPRVEMYKSFQGVTNVNDADVLADQVSKEVFSRTHSVTTTVRNEGPTRFRDIAIGSSVRIVIADRGLDEVWRFVGWLMDGEGTFWKPTLGRLAEKVKAFPRPPMPNDPGRALVEMSGRVSLAGYQDPLANGYTFPPNADGVAYSFSPIHGFGTVDTSNPAGGFTKAGTGITGRVTQIDMVDTYQYSPADRAWKILVQTPNPDTSPGALPTVTGYYKHLKSYKPAVGDTALLIPMGSEMIAVGSTYDVPAEFAGDYVSRHAPDTNASRNVRVPYATIDRLAFDEKRDDDSHPAPGTHGDVDGFTFYGTGVYRCVVQVTVLGAEQPTPYGSQTAEATAYAKNPSVGLWVIDPNQVTWSPPGGVEPGTLEWHLAADGNRIKYQEYGVDLAAAPLFGNPTVLRCQFDIDMSGNQPGQSFSLQIRHSPCRSVDPNEVPQLDPTFGTYDRWVYDTDQEKTFLTVERLK